MQFQISSIRENKKRATPVIKITDLIKDFRDTMCLIRCKGHDLRTIKGLSPNFVTNIKRI